MKADTTTSVKPVIDEKPSTTDATLSAKAADKAGALSAAVPHRAGILKSEGPADLQAFSHLVRTLYASVTAEEPFYGFLTELSDQMGALYATIIISRASALAPSLVITPRGKRDYIEAYRSHLFKLDPFINLPEGRVISIHDHLNKAMIDGAPVFNDARLPEKAEHILGVDLRAAGGFDTRIRITRGVGTPAFSDHERALFEMVIPHVRQALDLYQRLESTRWEHAVYAGAVERLALGTVILDKQDQVIKYNALAGAIFDEKDGLALAGRKICFDNAKTDTVFREFIRQSGMPEEAIGHRAIFRVERPSGKRDLGIVAHHIDTPDFLHAGSAPAIALFLADPERQFEVTGDALRELFGLTPMEAKIAASIANGLSVHESAESLGLATNTVRAHLRSVFAKTGVSRQSQLVYLVHTSLPELGSPPFTG